MPFTQNINQLITMGLLTESDASKLDCATAQAFEYPTVTTALRDHAFTAAHVQVIMALNLRYVRRLVKTPALFGLILDHFLTIEHVRGMQSPRFYEWLFYPWITPEVWAAGVITPEFVQLAGSEPLRRKFIDDEFLRKLVLKKMISAEEFRLIAEQIHFSQHLIEAIMKREISLEFLKQCIEHNCLTLLDNKESYDLLKNNVLTAEQFFQIGSNPASRELINRYYIQNWVKERLLSVDALLGFDEKVLAVLSNEENRSDITHMVRSNSLDPNQLAQLIEIRSSFNFLAMDTTNILMRTTGIPLLRMAILDEKTEWTLQNFWVNFLLLQKVVTLEWVESISDEYNEHCKPTPHYVYNPGKSRIDTPAIAAKIAEVLIQPSLRSLLVEQHLEMSFFIIKHVPTLRSLITTEILLAIAKGKQASVFCNEERYLAFRETAMQAQPPIPDYLLKILEPTKPPSWSEFFYTYRAKLNTELQIRRISHFLVLGTLDDNSTLRGMPLDILVLIAAHSKNDNLPVSVEASRLIASQCVYGNYQRHLTNKRVHSVVTLESKNLEFPKL